MYQKSLEPAVCQEASEKHRPWRALTFVRESINRVAATLVLWHFRAKSRREIERLDDRLLRDAGVDPSEANKPFWRK